MSNPTVTAGASALTLTLTGPNQVKVADGAAAAGTYNVGGNVFVSGSNAKDTVTFNLAGKSFGGNLFISTANGNDTVNLTNAGAAASLGGNVTVLTGLGNDTVNLGKAGALTIGGTAAVNDQAGADSLTFGNGAAVTKVGGSLAVLGVEAIQLDQGKNDVVGRDVTVSLPISGAPLDLNQGKLGGSEVLTIGGNFNVVGGPFSDDVALRGLNISGNLNVTLGGATGKNPTFPAKIENRLAVSSSAASVTVTSGNLNYAGGSGTDEVDLRGGVINGDVTVSLGDGNDGVLLASFGAQVTTIGGDLTVNGGNGNINVGSNGPNFPSANTAVIGGNANFNLGDGNNFVSFNNGGVVGGKVNYRSGNGNNSLLLAGAQTYAADVRFGSGDDTVTLNNAAAVLTGYVDGDGGSNTLTVTAGTLSPDLTLVGF